MRALVCSAVCFTRCDAVQLEMRPMQSQLDTEETEEQYMARAEQEMHEWVEDLEKNDPKRFKRLQQMAAEYEASPEGMQEEDFGSAMEAMKDREAALEQLEGLGGPQREPNEVRRDPGGRRALF